MEEPKSKNESEKYILDEKTIRLLKFIHGELGGEELLNVIEEIDKDSTTRKLHLCLFAHKKVLNILNRTDHEALLKEEDAIAA